MILKTIQSALGICGFLCIAIAYSLAVVALDKLFPAFGSWLWVSATIPIIAAGFWSLISTGSDA